MGKRDGRLILHIGAGKCGSSALQSALSANPRLITNSNEAVNYVAWRHKANGVGQLLTGSRVSHAANASKYGYATGPSALDPKQLTKFFKLLKQRQQKTSESYLASHEAWVQNFEKISDPISQFAQLDTIAFVRPPITWLNSAYWQWGYWSGLTFPKWSSQVGFWNMGTHLDVWSARFGERLSVRPSGRDVLGSLREFIGIQSPHGGYGKAQSSNRSSPRVLLRVLFRNKHLRPTAHDSSIEFVLGRWCDFSGLTSPWAVTPAALERLSSQYDPAVKRFFENFPDCAAICESDLNWLSPMETLMSRCEANSKDGREIHLEELKILCARLRAGAVKAGNNELSEVDLDAIEDFQVLEKTAVRYIELVRNADQLHLARDRRLDGLKSIAEDWIRTKS